MKNFEEIIKECKEYGSFTETPENESQARKSLAALIQEAREDFNSDMREDDLDGLYKLHDRFKFKAADHLNEAFIPFLRTVYSEVLAVPNTMGNIYKRNQVLTAIGREGFLDDTKPTTHEAKRNALKNNEEAMQKDNLGFYREIAQAIAVKA
ncbi:hypothetical protein [Roseateles sp. PN1]|uniref:hypothetical protein n=1 Tax=Roseateles sp. PN1 TaxID=3137372 RepID=UPI0031394254